jgi:hypothetical protein
VVRLFVVVIVLFSLSVLFVVEWFSTSCAERAFCFRDQYFVVDCTGFKIAGSYGKLLFLPITLSIVNAPRIIDIPDPHEVTNHPPLIVAHTPGTSDLRNSPFNWYFCGLCLSVSPCLWNINNKRGFFFSFRIPKISTRNESDTRSFHRRFSAQHHTRIQRPMGHSCHVMKAGCLLTCIKILNLLP